MELKSIGCGDTDGGDQGVLTCGDSQWARACSGGLKNWWCLRNRSNTVSDPMTLKG